MRTTHHGALSRRAWVPVVVLLVSLGCAACGSSGDGASSTDGSELFPTAEEVGLKLADDPGKRYPLAGGELGRLNDADDALAAWKGEAKDLKITLFKDDEGSEEEDILREHTGSEAAEAAFALTWGTAGSPCGIETRRLFKRQGTQHFEDGDAWLDVTITELESDDPLTVEKLDFSTDARAARITYGETSRWFSCRKTADISYDGDEAPRECDAGDECWITAEADDYEGATMRVGHWLVSLWGQRFDADAEALLQTIAGRLPT